MKRAVLAIPAFVFAAGVSFAQEHGGKIDWVRDPAIGFAKAKLEGRGLMLYFTATW